MPTSTWERLRPERRAKIIAAAQREFGAHGFSRASLNTIAREAGVAKGSLFQYFDDKLDFFAYLAELAAETIRTEITAAIAGLGWDDDFFGSLVEALGIWDDYFAAHPEERAITAAVNLEGDDQARVAVRQAVNPHYVAVLEPLVAMGQASGQLRVDANAQMAVAMLVLWLPHLALAPHVEGLDPVLGLDQRDRSARHEVYVELVDVFRRAFGSA